MSKGYSQDPIEGEEAARVRETMEEWARFQEEERAALSRVAWAVKNWKFLAFLVIMGAAGWVKETLQTAKEWLP